MRTPCANGIANARESPRARAVTKLGASGTQGRRTVSAPKPKIRIRPVAVRPVRAELAMSCRLRSAKMIF